MTPRELANEHSRKHNARTTSGGSDAPKKIRELQERIKRLEEAGDALCENSNPSRWDSLADAARKLTEQSNWIKAKEAKP
jgi:hypothetical protein